MSLYIYEDSPIHRLDPRSKVFLLIYITVLALILPNSNLLLNGGLIIVSLIPAIIGKSLKNILRFKALIVAMLIFTMLIWGITFAGEHRIMLIFTLEGLIYGFGTTLKIITIIISSIIFMSTTTTEEIYLGIVRLGIPYRIGFAFSMAMRFIPIILHISTTTIQAQKVRGLNLDALPFFKKVKCYACLLIPIFASVIKYTNNLAMALEVKGFGYLDKRSFYKTISYKKSDKVILGVMLCSIVVLIITEI